MAITNSIELRSSLPFPSLPASVTDTYQHEKKSCSLSCLPSDYLLQLNGLAVQLLVSFPVDHVITGKVLAVLIHSDHAAPSEILFLENGFSEPDMLNSSHIFLMGIVDR